MEYSATKRDDTNLAVRYSHLKDIIAKHIRHTSVFVQLTKMKKELTRAYFKHGMHTV